MPKRPARKSFFQKALPILKNIFGIVFVVIGFFFLYRLPVVNNSPQRKEPIVASLDFKKADSKSDVLRILISRVAIDLPVTPAKIVAGYWETSDTGASHGEGSANPGEGGNVVIFAHAKQGLFYNLKEVKKDDIIYVLTRNHWYRYKVLTIHAVYPKDVTTVAPTKKETLTLYTCSGFFDEKRLIVKAYPVK